MLSAVLRRGFAADEIDVVKRELGQVKDLANSVACCRAHILELRGQGNTHAEIARLLGCSRKAVSKVLELVRNKQVAEDAARKRTKIRSR